MQLCYFYCSNLLCTEDEFACLVNEIFVKIDQFFPQIKLSYIIHVHFVYMLFIQYMKQVFFSTSLQVKTVYTENENMQKELGISMFQLSFYMIKLEAHVSLSSLMRYRRFNAIAYLTVVRFRFPRT
jgi:hypothetical protein